MLEIVFQNKPELAKSLIPDQNFLEKLKSFLEKTVGHKYQMSLVLCNNDFIHTLNRDYRHIDSPTDVLSFSQTEGEDLNGVENELGDIILSLEKALSQSREFGVSFEEEIARLAIHGALHLLGYDHEKSEQQASEMFQKQDALLEEFMKENVS